jgi:hypothetical protein
VSGNKDLRRTSALKREEVAGRLKLRHKEENEVRGFVACLGDENA